MARVVLYALRVARVTARRPRQTDTCCLGLCGVPLCRSSLISALATSALLLVWVTLTEAPPPGVRNVAPHAQASSPCTRRAAQKKKPDPACRPRPAYPQILAYPDGALVHPYSTPALPTRPRILSPPPPPHTRGRRRLRRAARRAQATRHRPRAWPPRELRTSRAVRELRLGPAGGTAPPAPSMPRPKGRRQTRVPLGWRHKLPYHDGLIHRA